MMVYKNAERSKSRRGYETSLAWIFGLTAFFGVLAYLELKVAGILLLCECFIMLLGGIVMAIGYFIDCVIETRHLFDGDKRGNNEK